MLSRTTPVVPQPKKAPAGSDTSTGIDIGSLLDKVQAALMQAVSKLLRINIENIDVDAELNKYGFDSITLTEFANILNQEYKLELTPTIFFEHSTIHSFAEYLVEEHQQVLASKFSVQARTETPARTMEDEAEESPSTKVRRSR